MSVVGIDFGNLTCFTAIARAGGIETIANEYSDRCTPSYVSFMEKSRCMGTSAKNQSVTNFKNTVYGFKRLVGRTFSDPHTQHEVTKLPCKVGQDASGSPVYQVHYMGEQQEFTPQQITAMMFTKLKHVSEKGLKTKVTDVVVSVPSFYTDIERRALIDACQMAGLNCLRLMNDTTAAALAYGIFKQDLPEEKEKSRNVVLVDLGHSSLQVSATAFNKGKMKILAVATDPHLGGRDFDKVLVDHAVEEIKKKYKIDPRTNPKALLKIQQEMEKVKKLMSSNTQPIPYNLECLMEDKDVSGKVERTQFEELAANLLNRVESTLQAILDFAKLSSQDLYSVEIIGGSCRIPAVKSLVHKVFGMDPSTTLNADEAVSRGCALQCAILSPTFRVRDFSISDCQLYPITLQWQGGLEDDNTLEVFPRFHSVPFSKMLTFYRKEAFQLDAQYSYPKELPHPTSSIGSFKIIHVQPQPGGDSSKVKVKVRVNIHGVFTVCNASMVEKLENQPEENDTQDAMDVDEDKKSNSENSDESKKESSEENAKSPPENEEAPMQTESENSQKKEEAPAAESKTPEKKKVKKTKIIDLPIESYVPQLTKEELNKYVERENGLIMQDKLEQERSEAKNSVEEYVYDVREKLYGSWEQFAEEQDKSKLRKILDDTENWLYDEGEDQKKQVYVDKLAEMKKLGQPIADRYSESLERPLAFDNFGKSLQKTRKFLEACTNKDEKYDHLDPADVEKVQKCLNEKQSWYESKLNQQAQKKLYENPIVLTSQICSEHKLLESTCKPIMNKPKPKVEPPKEEKKEEKNASNSNSQEQPPADKEQQNAEQAAGSQESEKKVDMEVD